MAKDKLCLPTDYIRDNDFPIIINEGPTTENLLDLSLIKTRDGRVLEFDLAFISLILTYNDGKDLNSLAEWFLTAV